MHTNLCTGNGSVLVMHKSGSFFVFESQEGFSCFLSELADFLNHCQIRHAWRTALPLCEETSDHE
jgi:hypothetical protein